MCTSHFLLRLNIVTVSTPARCSPVGRLATLQRSLADPLAVTADEGGDGGRGGGDGGGVVVGLDACLRVGLSPRVGHRSHAENTVCRLWTEGTQCEGGP